MGRANYTLKRNTSIFLIIMLLVSIIPKYVYAKEEKLDTTIVDKGILYLSNSQKEDGSWNENQILKVLTTTEVLRAFEKKNIKNETEEKAKNWLNEQDFSNLDLKARAVSFLQEDKKKISLEEIANSQNEDGGFGVTKEYGSDIFDTVIVAKTLSENNAYKESVDKAIRYIITHQNEDGSWSESELEEGSIYVTALVRDFLLNYDENYNGEAINLSESWLLNNKDFLGSINKNNFEDYCYLFWGLWKDNYEEVEKVVENIKNLQSDNGSWYNNSYFTALAIEVLLKDEEVNECKIEEVKLLLDNEVVTEISANKTLEIKTDYYGRNCTLDAKVYDKDNNEFELYTLNDISDVYYWDVALNECGDYKVEVSIKDKEGNIKDTVTKAIKVLPYLKAINGNVELSSYYNLKEENVSPTVDLTMDGITNIKGNCEITTSIVDKDGTSFFENTLDKEIVNGENKIQTATFSTLNFNEGVYKVKVSINYEGKEILNIATNYRLIGKLDSLYTLNSDFDKGIMENVSYAEVDNQLQLSKQNKDFYSLIFTLNDIILFGYEDGTNISVYDEKENLKWEGTLNKGEQKTIKVNKGIYKAKSNNKFAILSGDPVTNRVSGYYAMDKEGYGASTELYTWIPVLYSSCSFIVFAMEDNTDVKVCENDTGNVIWEGTLNKGEHWSDKTLSGKFVHITANKKVSALTDYDQSYYAPSVNGNWSGTEFYTHVGDTGSWTHELTVASYKDNNKVTITNTVTGEEIWSGILDYGQAKVLTYSYGTDTYFTIKSEETVTVCVQPWLEKTSSYNQGVYVMDKDGIGLGTEFIATSLTNGELNVLSYKDGTNVEIYDSRTGEFINSYKLNAGEYRNINPGNGLWLIKSNKNISIYSGYGTASAGFTPVEFGGMVMEKEGSWNVINSSDTLDYFWSKIVWTEEKPEGTNIIVKARTANTLEDLEKAEYIQLENGIKDERLKGKFIQVNVQFMPSKSISPILKDIYIGEEDRIVADAGEDQYIYSVSSEGQLVQLDGSKSYDSTGKDLIYKWTWDGGEATGVNPVVKLKEGITEISLVVSNGVAESEVDKVKINIVKELVDSSIKTNKDKYSTMEEVDIKASIENPIDSKLNFTGEIAITDLEGNIIEVLDKNINCTLEGEELKELDYKWNTNKTLPGKYKVIAIWYQDGEEISKCEAEFDIIPEEKQEKAENLKTGDKNHVMPILVVMLLSLIVISLLYGKRQGGKKHVEE